MIFLVPSPRPHPPTRFSCFFKEDELCFVAFEKNDRRGCGIARSNMANRLSENDMRELKDTFTLFDQDGDGLIASKEVVTVMRSVGKNPTESEVRSIIGEIEAQKSKVVPKVPLRDGQDDKEFRHRGGDPSGFPCL